jgi:hypothetical protein
MEGRHMTVMLIPDKKKIEQYQKVLKKQGGHIGAGQQVTEPVTQQKEKETVKEEKITK